MEYEPLAPKPAPVYSQGFRYNGTLTVKGIPRFEPSEVRRLIFEPKGATPDQLYEWRLETQRTATRPWLEAQTRHYGMELRPRDSYQKDELRNLLREESLKPDFTDIRRQYRAFYNGSFEKVKAEWEAQCAAYKESCFSGRRQADFDNLATLEEKLNFDIDMFMETYYSSRETLPSPMLFRGINFDVVMEAVAQVPGLYSQKSGNDFQKCLFVGWDKKEVKQACKEYLTLAKENATARRLRIKQSHALSHEKKVDRAIAWRMLAHQEYLERRSRERGNHMIEGSYVVEMTFRRANREEYTPERQFMDIRATTYPGVYEATFNFTPAMEGVMVLAETEEAVQKWISFFEPDPAQAPAPTTSNNSEPQAGSKRKKNQTNDGENGSSAGPNAKRMRAASPHVLEGYSTYFMRWRGRVGIPLYKDTYRNEEGEGFVYFLESNKAQFIIDEVKVPLLADATKGYKVSDQPKFTASKWAS